MQTFMRKFLIIKKRILQYLEFKGISKYKFYQETGITNGILSQSNGISEDSVLKFLSYYRDISAEWLLTGEGEMLKKEGEIGSNGKEEETEREQIERLSKEVGVWQTRYEELKKKRAPEAEDAGCAGAAV